jgi:hypothetical protein
MRSIVAIALYCTLLNTSTFGQDSGFKKNAIYLSFEEFRNNTPSITGHTLNLGETDQYLRSIEYDNYGPDTVKKLADGFGGFLTTRIFISNTAAAQEWLSNGEIIVYSAMSRMCRSMR